jgi:tetratricopeptide (TPR) repeat protein
MKKNRKRPMVTPAAPVAPAAPPAVAPASASLPWRRHLPILLCLWAAAFLAYSNSFQAGLTFDNGVAIQQDPRIRSTAGIGQIFTEEYWYPNNTTGLYRPLATLSFLFNYTLLGNGANPPGYHWVNLALHAVNIALVYFLGLLLLEEVAWAGVLAAVWGLHPLLTESVTNIVGRADELAALGVFTGLLCHIRAGQSVGLRKLAWLAGLAASAAIAVFSKESGAAIVAAMICYDVAFGRSQPWRPRVAGYAAAAAPLALFFFLRGRMLDHIAVAVIPFVDNPLGGASFPVRVMTSIRIVGKYLWLFLWPAHLSADYSYNQIPVFRGSFAWDDVAALLSLAVCLAAAVWGIRAWRRGQPLVGFAVAFFFATMMPTANVLVVVGSIMAERWLYLPSFALALGVAMGLRALERRVPNVPRMAILAAVGVLCLAWIVRTYVRNLDWRDDPALWSSAAQAVPHSFKPPDLLANELVNATPPQVERAIQEAERATAILDPLSDEQNLSRPYAVKGMCYRAKADRLANPAQRPPWLHKALDALERARRIDLAGREVFNRANQQAGKGQFETGLALLYLELGRVQRRLQQWQPALQSLSYGRELSPLPEFSEEASQVYRDMGNPDQAAVALLEGMIIDPRSRRLAGKVVQLYQATAPRTCAVETNGNGSSFNPQCPLVHNHICEAARNVMGGYRSYGKADRAAATAQTAISGMGCPASLFQ